MFEILLFRKWAGPKGEMFVSCLYESAYLKLTLKIHSVEMETQQDLPGHRLSTNRLSLGINIQPDKHPIYQSVSRNDTDSWLESAWKLWFFSDV